MDSYIRSVYSARISFISREQKYFSPNSPKEIQCSIHPYKRLLNGFLQREVANATKFRNVKGENIGGGRILEWGREK